MSNIREGMEENNKKIIRAAVEQTKDEILNNGSSGGTNDAVPNAVPDLSVPSPMNK